LAAREQEFHHFGRDPDLRSVRTFHLRQSLSRISGGVASRGGCFKISIGRSVAVVRISEPVFFDKSARATAAEAQLATQSSCHGHREASNLDVAAHSFEFADTPIDRL
jgi:hypothetical protein